MVIKEYGCSGFDDLQRGKAQYDREYVKRVRIEIDNSGLREVNDQKK
jgi:hypothetical protein